MSHVRPQVHEWSGSLLYDDHDDRPYWTLRRIFSHEIDGGAKNVPVEIAGPEWSVSLSFQESGLQPRTDDDASQLYEYRLNADVANDDDHRTVALLIQPRLGWEDDARRPKSVPASLGESVNIRVEKIVNVEPRDARQLIPELLSGALDELGASWNDSFFTGSLHEYSCLTQLELYVRIQRDQARKIVRSDGVFHRLFHTVADEEGSKIVYSADNREIVGYNHQIRLNTKAISKTLPGWRTGGQFKHYHPEHVGGRDDEDPLYHPKVGFLYKKKWNDNTSISWSDVEKLQQQCEENLMNLLEWSDVPTKPGSWFVEDDHFKPEASDRDVAFFDDPTPEIESDQDSVILRTMSRLQESDRDVLEEVADQLPRTDGGVHVDEIEQSTGWASSTIYRVLQRLGGLLENEHGNVSFVSSKISERVRDVIQQIDDVVDSAARAIEDVLSVDPRDLERSGRAWQNWLNRYGAEVDLDFANGRGKVRIRQIMSDMKSDPVPHLPEVLGYGRIAWDNAGRDITRFPDFVEYDVHDGTVTARVNDMIG